jgi:NADH-quinone oxidoreductase subunit L
MLGLDYYPLLIPLAPLAAALLTALPRGLVREVNYRLGVFCHVAALVASLVVLRTAAAPGHPAVDLVLFGPPDSPLQFAFHLDRLAAVMMTLISGIGTLLYLYSLRYMQQEAGRARYHTLLAFTIATLLCMVSSANLVMLFLCWQLLSWLLSFLAYNHVHPPTARGAFRTFVMLRFGDVAFLAGIVMAYTVYGTLNLEQLFARAALTHPALALWPGGPELQASTAITLLLFVGAMSKSAQMPLHMWLPDSLYAPTPVHALLHAGIINAGGFLINRLAPLYGFSPATLHVAFAVGLCTALLGAGMMLVQNDIKKTLGYSTIGQMGYMIMECGLGAFALAVFHLIAHGLFKATIFLNCGNVIHLARQEPRRPDGHQMTGAGAPAADHGEGDFSTVTWLTGFVTTLILPLIILLAGHGALSLPMRDSQGVVIFLFFSWVTSSQAILTLYRVRAVASRKVAGLMLLTLVLVVMTYLLAAEAFTYFLYPVPGEVAFYFQAAALPTWLFDSIVAVTALFVIVGWVSLYARSRGRSMPLPAALAGRLERWQVTVYLFLINRLYLDAAALAITRALSGAIHRLDQSRLLLAVGAAVALVPLFSVAVTAAQLPAAELMLLAIAVFTLPLFPFHGVYVAALTRVPGYLPVLFAVLLPAVGFYALLGLLTGLPPSLLRSLGALALLGALYGTLKAAAQFRVRRMIAYTGLTFYALLWWQLAVTGGYSPQAGVYARAVILVTGGLLLAWHAVQARFGNLDMDRIGGLMRTMPRFALCFALLIMAGVGLPPFGLFFGFLGLLLHPGVGSFAGDLMIVLLAWFCASWYLFKMLQRLLFGPPRADLAYDDLRLMEIASLVLVLAALIGVGMGSLRGVGASEDVVSIPHGPPHSMTVGMGSMQGLTPGALPDTVMQSAQHGIEVVSK